MDILINQESIMDEKNNYFNGEQWMLSMAADRQKPVTGSLELLPLCNMNCRMCYIHLNKDETEAGGGLHSADEWIQLGKQMAEAGVLFLLLTGGEPLLFPDFKRLYLELKQMGMILTVNTNGTLLDRDWADFFANHRPRRINITLYGANDETYKNLCNYPGGFQKAVAAVKLLQERKVDVKINGVVTKYNRSDIDSIFRIGQELNVPVFADTYLLPGLKERGLPFDKQSRLLPEDAAAAEIFVKKKEMGHEVFQKYATDILHKCKSKAQYPKNITCLAGKCSFAIGWQGFMRPCVTFDKPAVSVFEEGFASAWNKISNKAQELEINAKCVSCLMRPACQVCPASSYIETGVYDGVPDYLCRYTKEIIRLFEIEVQSDARQNG